MDRSMGRQTGYLEGPYGVLGICNVHSLCFVPRIPLPWAELIGGKKMRTWPQKQSSRAVALVQRCATETPRETFQNTNVQFNTSWRFSFIVSDRIPQEVCFEEATQLLLVSWVPVL